MIQSYKKPYQVDDDYEAILIGSGMGCLAAGAYLAKEGKKVLILERHYTAGGFTHVFKRKGYEWDVGIHYIGDLERENSSMKRMFDYITDGQLKWADMGTVYDRVIIGEEQFEFVKGVSNFKKKILSYFPDEEKAIDAYVDAVFAANKAMGKYYLDKALPNYSSFFLSGVLRKSYLKYSDRSTYEVLKELTSNEKLIKVLTAQYGDYGMTPKQSSFAMHAAVAKHYFNGGYFPIGGASQIVENVLPIIEAAGGTLLISAEVDEVLIDNDQAVGVKMKDGKAFYSKTVISGAGVFNTFQKLIPKATAAKHQLLKKLESVKPSVASGCLYIGLNADVEELNLPKNNLWIFPEEGDHDTCLQKYVENAEAEFPLVYVSFPAAKDPSWSERYPGSSTIDVITLLPYENFAAWDGTRWMKRGDQYEAYKEKITQRLLKILFKQLPQIESHLDHYELSTPLSTKHFVNYDRGEIYGLEHSPERYQQKFLKPRTPIKGLYLTGQDIVTAGVGAAMFAGFITAAAITGQNFMKKIFATN